MISDARRSSVARAMKKMKAHSLAEAVRMTESVGLSSEDHAIHAP